MPGQSVNPSTPPPKCKQALTGPHEGIFIKTAEISKKKQKMADICEFQMQVTPQCKPTPQRQFFGNPKCKHPVASIWGGGLTWRLAL